MKDSDLIFGLMASLDKNVYTYGDLRYLTEPFGVSETSLRSNLSRMASAGLIQSDRQGRNAYYRFARKGQRISANVSSGFRALQWDGWTGEYWGVIFSVPDAKSENRHSIRKKLTKYRFACLNPGFWIRPLHPEEAIPEILNNILTSGFCRLIRFANHSEFTVEEINAMWNLQEINKHFQDGLRLLAESFDSLSIASPQQAFVLKMTVGNDLVQLIFDDPMLPPDFLPSDWQGDSIREQFQRFDNLATARSKPFWENILIQEDAV